MRQEEQEEQEQQQRQQQETEHLMEEAKDERKRRSVTRPVFPLLLLLLLLLLPLLCAMSAFLDKAQSCLLISATTLFHCNKRSWFRCCWSAQRGHHRTLDGFVVPAAE